VIEAEDPQTSLIDIINKKFLKPILNHQDIDLNHFMEHSVSDGDTTSSTLWSRVLANQEDPGPKVDGSRDEDDSMDVWLY